MKITEAKWRERMSKKQKRIAEGGGEARGFVRVNINLNKRK